MIIKKIISVIICLMATGGLMPSSRLPSSRLPSSRLLSSTSSSSISKRSLVPELPSSASSARSAFQQPRTPTTPRPLSTGSDSFRSVTKKLGDSMDSPTLSDESNSYTPPAKPKAVGSSTGGRRSFLKRSLSESSVLSGGSTSSQSLSFEDSESPLDWSANDYAPLPKATTKKMASHDINAGIETTTITPLTAQIDKQLGTGVFAKQNFQLDSPVIYQSPSKRLKALESQVADIERLTKLYNTTPPGALKARIKTTLDNKLAQVKKVYTQDMGGKLVDPDTDTLPATNTANKKLKTKIKDFISTKLAQVKRMYSKEGDDTSKESKDPNTPSYRAALDRSKQKRFDNIRKNLAKIDTKLSAPTPVPATDVPQKAAAKRMQAAANWAKGFFEKKLYKTFINEEVSSVLRAYNLSDPKQQKEAVRELTENLATLQELTKQSTILSKSNKRYLDSLVTKYQAATNAQHNAQENSCNIIFKQLDTLAGKQASVFKRAIARLGGCTSWSQFQAKRAFDSQMNHANLDVLAEGALAKIPAGATPQKRKEVVDEYFATMQKPATTEQEAKLQQFKDYIVTDFWTKKTKMDKLTKQAELVKQWKQYDKADELWEAWNKHKTGDEPQKPQTPGGNRPSDDKIAKLEAKIAATKELDQTLFAKKGLLQQVQHLTVPLKNKWLRAAVITAAVVVTTAAIAAIVIASYGAALAVVLPVIADIGTVAIIAHRTVKQADTATGGQLTTVVQQAAGVIGNAARNTIETEQSAKDKRKHAKGGLLSAAIQNQTHSDAQAKLDDAQPAQEAIPALRHPKQKHAISAEQAKAEEARKLGTETNALSPDPQHVYDDVLDLR